MSSLSSAATPARAAAPPLRVSHLGDELLARYAARGSDRAFGAIYERYHQRLYRYCRSILRNDTDAQDALQSTFTGAFAALKRSQRNAPLRPWLYRIAHNEAISLLRRRNRDASEELPDEISGAGYSAEQEVIDRARWRTLLEDLGGLPARQRGALLLRELSGLSHEEIGIALGTTTAGAKQAIFEARQALGEIEEGRAMTCEEVRMRLSEGDRRVLRGRKVAAHLRECAACEGFALAIPARRAQLAALTPVLAPAAAGLLFSRSLRAASAHGGAAGGSTAASAGMTGATSAGMTGKALSVALTWKAVAAGAAVIAATTAGVTGLVPVLHNSSASPGPVSGAGPTHQVGQGHASSGGRGGAGSTGATGKAAGVGGHPARDHASPAPHGRNSKSGAAIHKNSLNGSSHGQSGTNHRNSTSAPGHSSTGHGNSVNAPGHGSVGHGNSLNAPGHGSTGHGNSVNAPGHSTAGPVQHSHGHGNGPHPQHTTGKHLGYQPRVPVAPPKVHVAPGQGKSSHGGGKSH